MSFLDDVKSSVGNAAGAWMEFGTEAIMPPKAADRPVNNPDSAQTAADTAKPTKPPATPGPKVVDPGVSSGFQVSKKHLMIAGGVVAGLLVLGVGWRVVK